MKTIWKKKEIHSCIHKNVYLIKVILNRLQFVERSLKITKSNQKLQIEGQTIQWPKENKFDLMNTTQKIKSNTNPTTNGVNSRAEE